jgi:ankyrin repeat protein
MIGEPQLLPLIRAIAKGDTQAVLGLLAAAPGLARAALETGASRAQARDWYLTDIAHYAYAGDTALHIAAAGYRVDLARKLIALGADVAARNRRGAQPLHYAVDGHPGLPGWDPAAQAATVTALIEAGADPNAADTSGVAPLHRAIRTRSAQAVAALLAGGADPRLSNRCGSTPLKLAQQTTGRGGSGSPEAKAEQAEILRLLAPYGDSVR